MRGCRYQLGPARSLVFWIRASIDARAGLARTLSTAALPLAGPKSRLATAAARLPGAPGSWLPRTGKARPALCAIAVCVASLAVSAALAMRLHAMVAAAKVAITAALPDRKLW